MNEIEQWLNNQEDYNAGVALYNKYGNSPSLKRVLTINGNTKRNRETLVYELGKIKGNIKPERNINQVKQYVTKTVMVTATSIDKNSEEIKSIIETKNRLFKQYVAYYHQLEHLNDEERKKAALQILDIMDEVQRLWSIIDYFNQHGNLPPVKVNPSKENKVKEMDKAQLLTYRNNSLRPSISQLKKKLKQVKQPAKVAELQDQLDKKELLLREVELKLQLA